jgi:hypothetical protein
MHLDSALEDWLIKVGGDTIEKKATQGEAALTPVETAVCNLWLIDYAVRNSGSFGPLQDMNSNALASLLVFSQEHRLSFIARWLAAPVDEAAFCSTYYEHFNSACSELRRLWAST